MTKYELQEHDLIVIDNKINPDKKYILKVKDLAEGDKPREKMMEQGVESLSATELLAIVLGTGTKKEEVLAMSSRILKEYGEKTIVNQKNSQALEKELNIPLIKACQIVACFELGRRFFKKENGGPITIRSSKQAFQYLKDMQEMPKEQFRGLYLNSRYKLIHDEVISIGSLTASVIHPREVFKPALEYSAAAIIVAHNHPSGSTQATSADLEVTKKLLAASQILGIDLLDHIIITKNKFISLIK